MKIYKSLLPIFIILSLVGCNEKTTIKKRPNILFIFADDQTFHSINALGNDEVITPNLDRLAKKGTTFTRSYNMGGWNGAVCIASRSMLLTGQYLWNAYKVDSLMRINAYQEPLLSDLMAREGYDTYMSGKWHVKQEADSVFQVVRHARPGMPNQTESGYNRPKNEKDTSWLPWDKSKEGFWKGGKHWSEVLKDDALDYIDSAKQKENPFFIYLAFNAPHDPRQSPKAFVDRYPLENVAMPINYLPEYPYKEEMGSGENLRDERLAPFPRTEHAVKAHRQEYYAIITHMDEQIGEILNALKASGKADNTYIFFSADHGLSVGQHGLIGKQNMYEHSMRVPLIVAGPDIPKGKKIDAPVYLQDIMPSILELANAEKPQEVDFKSLLPLIKGKQQAKQYEAIYGAYRMHQRMIMKDNMKLIAYPNANILRLYNLEKDALEMEDLADEEGYADIKLELFDELKRLQKQMNDKLELRKENFFPAPNAM
jgi:arylsulfatase A-like enzyme